MDKNSHPRRNPNNWIYINENIVEFRRRAESKPTLAREKIVKTEIIELKDIQY